MARRGSRGHSARARRRLLLTPPLHFLRVEAGIMSSSIPAFHASLNHTGFSSSHRPQFSKVHAFTSSRIEAHCFLLYLRAQ